MNIKKTELRVSINCYKCKTEVLKAVTKLDGVDQVSVDAEKGIVTVVGVVDPVCVTKQVRKTGKYVEVISVGTPKKPDDPKPPAPKDTPLPSCCPQCQVVVAYGFESYDDSGRLCTIL